MSVGVTLGVTVGVDVEGIGVALNVVVAVALGVDVFGGIVAVTVGDVVAVRGLVAVGDAVAAGVRVSSSPQALSRVLSPIARLIAVTRNVRLVTRSHPFMASPIRARLTRQTQCTTA
jgi:hypothetical protein